MATRFTLFKKSNIFYCIFGLCGIIALILIQYVPISPNQQPKKIADSQQIPRPNVTFTPDSEQLPLQYKAYLISKIKTLKPVVFLTIDDGQHKDKRAMEFIRSRQWPVTLFITDKYAQQDYKYFKSLIKHGASLQNHTLSHQYLNDLTYDQQKTEICGASAKYATIFNSKSTLLRPPGGYYDPKSFSSAYECGIQALVMWSAKVDGGMVQFQRGDRLVAGDIVLMHFRPTIMKDLAAFEAEIIKQGLYVARLEDWIKVSP